MNYHIYNTAEQKYLGMNGRDVDFLERKLFDSLSDAYAYHAQYKCQSWDEVREDNIDVAISELKKLDTTEPLWSEIVKAMPRYGEVH